MSQKSRKTSEQRQKAQRYLCAVFSVALGIMTTWELIYLGGFPNLASNVKGTDVTPSFTLAVFAVAFIAVASGVSVAQIAYDTITRHIETQEGA